MNKKERAIFEVENTDFYIINGAKKVRTQINYPLLNALDDLKDSDRLIDRAFAIRKDFNRGIRKARRGLEDLQEAIENPGPGPYDPKVRDLCGGFLGIKLDWMANAVKSKADKKDAKERITDFLVHSAQLGIRELDYFDWLSDEKTEHEHLNLITPWKYISAKNEFHLKRHNELYFDLTEEFLEMVNFAKMKPRPHLVMAQAYSKFPLMKNIQETAGLWDARNWPFIGAVADRESELMLNICDWGFEWKIANEPAHRGDPDRWHYIMYFHEYIYEKHLANWMTLNEIVCDRSACEGTTSELIGVQPCPKPRSSLCRGGYHGKPEYGRGRLGRKSVWAEAHGVETVEDLIRGSKLAFMGSGWRKYILHGDGGSWTRTGEGSTWGNLTFATPDQAYDMGVYLWNLAQDKNRRAKYCWFPIESLTKKDGIVREYYHIDLKDRHGNSVFDKARALIQAHREVYG